MIKVPINNDKSKSVEEAILTRRSVRKFTNDVIPENELKSMLMTVGRAASGGNM
jgi:nitroreductase